jgi:hypothetical protein
MGSILLAEEETIVLSTIYDYVAQYPILKYEGIYHSNPKYINIKVDKIYTYQNSIIVDIEYVTMNNKNIISYELNQDNNIIYTSCDVDSNFIKDIMFLSGIVNFKFIETYKSKMISEFAYLVRDCYRFRISSGYDFYYKFLYIYAGIFSDINDGPMFGDDVMYSSEESAIRFLKNGSICVVENSNNHKYNKNIEFVPLYIIEYLIQGCYLDAIQIQSDIEELRRQSEENINNWISISS